MSTAVKYQISRIVVAITVPVMCYCLSHIIPAGLAGNTLDVKRWFVIFAMVAIIGVISFVAMQYWKAELDNGDMPSEAEILSNAAVELARQKQASAAERISPSAPSGQAKQHQATGGRTGKDSGS